MTAKQKRAAQETLGRDSLDGQTSQHNLPISGPPSRDAIDLASEFQSGQKTAKVAAAILAAKRLGFVIPTEKQRQNLLVAFAKRGKVVYGKAFDIVKLSAHVDLNDLADTETTSSKSLSSKSSPREGSCPQTSRAISSP